jgi:hypothetical protein
LLKTTAGPVCVVAARSKARRSAATPRSLTHLRRASRPPRYVFNNPLRPSRRWREAGREPTRCA